MPEFSYLVVDSAGQERHGTIAAPDAERARQRLVARKLYVLEVKQGRTSVPGGSLSSRLMRRQRLSGKELATFTRQLATLNEVSPLEEALRTIVRQAEAPQLRSIVSAVHAGVLEGRRLSDALRREEKSFPPLYRAMVAAGESSGSLPEILNRMADLLERQAQVRSKVQSTLAYPIVLALVAVMVVTALMVFVIPKVVEQFDTVGQRLPLLTRIVIGISDLLVNWGWAIALVLTLSVAGLLRALREPGFRMAFDRWLLRLPLVGRLIRDLHAARFACTLGTMVASRLPLLEGIILTTPTITNRALRAATEDIVDSVRGGGSLSAAMRRTGVFPPLLVYLAASGETAGRLDAMLGRAADYLEREFDGFMATSLALLEPLIIVVMGGLVALIVLSILLPILQLQTLAGT